MKRLGWTAVLALGLAVAITGGAFAGSKITGGQIKDGTITGRDVKNRSLRPADFKGSVRGPRGPVGPAGPVNTGSIVRVAASKTIPAGGIDSVSATCPAGYGLVSGGFSGIAADGEVFYADDFGSGTSWSVGLDNFDSLVEGDVTAVAYCAPAGKAVVASGAKRSTPHAVRVGMERMEARLRATKG